MSRRRFFVEPGVITGDIAIISGELYHHMIQVLRLSVGDEVILADGSRDQLGKITAIDRERLTVSGLTTHARKATTRTLAITLYQGVPKGEKLEMVLQKGSELGAHAFVPVQCERSVSRLMGERSQGKIERWQRIAREAARQSGCSSVPEVREVVTLGQAVTASNEELKLLLWEDEKQRHLRQILTAETAPRSVALLVGPEGGLTPEEAAMAIAHGFVAVTLGSRILRTETAGLAAISILQYVWGDLG
jgi:16S rRNA (uracil1498-N3)-methyltransferase